MIASLLIDPFGLKIIEGASVYPDPSNNIDVLNTSPLEMNTFAIALLPPGN